MNMPNTSAMSKKRQLVNLVIRIIAGTSSAISFSCFAYAQSEHETGELNTSDLGAPFLSPIIYCVST